MTTIDRREFLGVLGAGATWWAAGDTTFARAALDRIGVQLYTVRTEMEKDFDGTLARVAAIGYKEVEFAGYFKRTPAAVRDALKKAGLAAPSAHVQYPELADPWPGVLDAAKTVGHQYLVNPWIDEKLRTSADDWKRIAATFNRAGEISRKAGIQFAYHNHHFEFAPVNGEVPFDILLKECDPALVQMELDLCWITVAGRDPLEYFKRHPGRFPMVHIKEMARLPPRPFAETGALPFEQLMPNMTDVGKGATDWARIFARSSEAGIKHYFVEHDQPKAPFDSIKASYDHLRQLK